jgi:Tol biopolymer transport system component
MKTIALLLFLLVGNLTAQTGSEIYLADLNISKAGISLSNPKNITNRKGYDNQPYFHPDKPLIYFASFNDQDRSDIKAYNYRKNTTEPFTQTSEREYSPTVTPDKKYITCIIQRDDGAQNLGKYPIHGGSPVVLIDNLIVGYHAWVSSTQLALFVLGESMTLRLYDLNKKTDSVIASNIGRSLHKIPESNGFSFVDKSSAPWKINLCTNGKIETITETLPDQEDIAWTHDGKIIISDGRQFFFFDTQKSEQKWQMFYSSETKGITRIAVSADGKKIAFVVSE